MAAQLYSSKIDFEQVVVNMFQNRPITGIEFKAYKLGLSFKCGPCRERHYGPHPRFHAPMTIATSPPAQLLPRPPPLLLSPPPPPPPPPTTTMTGGRTITYFWLKNPASKTKVLKIGSENAAVVTALYAQVRKYTTAG